MTRKGCSICGKNEWCSCWDDGYAQGIKDALDRVDEMSYYRRDVSTTDLDELEHELLGTDSDTEKARQALAKWEALKAPSPAASDPDEPAP